MSADNYIYVRLRKDGKVGISHRYASTYYSDEITLDEVIEENPNHTVDGQWISPPEEDIEIYDLVSEALVAAHRMYEKEAIVEYGVICGPGVV